MRIEKHLVGQKVLVRYMEDTDSDILGLGFLITSSIMWISNRGHNFRVGGIRFHPTGVFSKVLMQKKRHDSRKTSYWSNSDCAVHVRYRQLYPRFMDRVFNNLVIYVDIEPRSRILCSRHPITSDWRVFECVDDKEATR